MALVQACQDARRAYKNWFDSLAGRRKGPRIRHPKPRRKRGRQSIRLTRNGFALHGERLYVAKVGDIRVEWSRGLPSVPSSVTVIREPDGRYYASFVVEREATPLPACDREAGIDLGLEQPGRHLGRRDGRQPAVLPGGAAAAQAGAAGAVPQAERFREPGQGPAPGRGGAPQGARCPARPRAQDGTSAGPRQPSGLRRGPVRVRAGPHPAGQVRRTMPAGRSCCGVSRRRRPSMAARSARSAGSSPPARCARPAA